MNWDDIITAALISTTLSTLISSTIAYFLYRNQKIIDYNYDYRKYILEKRKPVYDKIEVIINTITKTWIYTVTGYNYQVHYFVSPNGSINHYDDFNKVVSNSLDDSIWLSEDVRTILHDLSGLLVTLSIETQTKGLKHFDQIILATQNFETIQNFSDRLTKCYFNDIIHLSDIKGFIKDKTESIPKA